MTNPSIQPDIIDVKELQKILQIGCSTAYRLLKSGEIPSFKIGNIYKIPRKSLQLYVDAKLNTNIFTDEFVSRVADL